MQTEYRFINHDNCIVSNEEHAAAIALLESAGWHDYSPTIVPGGVRITPQTADYQAAKNIDVLRELAAYLHTGTITLEVTRDPEPQEKVWLHLVYGPNGVQETETLAGQYLA